MLVYWKMILIRFPGRNGKKENNIITGEEKTTNGSLEDIRTRIFTYYYLRVLRFNRFISYYLSAVE